MQLAGNAALAEALEPRQVRQFEVRFMVDWAGDGLYADPNSDLSEAFVSAVVDRQLAGNYPAELEVTEGYAAAQVTVTLEGFAPDGTSLVRLFSPYSGLYPGTVSAINTPCYLDVIVITSAGPVTIRQFTGVVRNTMPVRQDGSVTLILRDASALLQAPMDLACWAVSGILRRGTFTGMDDSETVLLSWLIDHVLRRNGWMQGPAWHPNVVLAWTLNGGALPEVGHFATMDPWVADTYGAFWVGYYDWQLPSVSPAGMPNEVWKPSPHGYAFVGLPLPDWYLQTEGYLQSNAHATTRVNPLTFGANNSNLLGFSWQVEMDVAQSSIYMGNSEILVHCEELRHYPSVPANDKPSYAKITFSHYTGVINLWFVGDGWTKTWQWQGGIATTPTRWVNMYAVLRFTSAGITPYVYADGVAVTMTAVGTPPAWPPPAMSYTWPASSTTHGRVKALGPANYAQVFYQADTLIGGLIAPSFVPPAVTASVDMSSLRLQWFPKLRQQPAWDLLRELASADMGALYITEQGQPVFESRATVMAKQDTANVALHLTLDHAQVLEPQTVLESVINHLTWELSLKWSEISWDGGWPGTTSVFAATNSGQFPIAAGVTRSQPLTLTDDVMQVRISSIPVQPQAQGYLANGGANAAWQDFMQYYSPSYWGNGFTGYVPGTRTDPSIQPVQAVGVGVAVSLGFVDYTDIDPSHIRLTFTNTSGTGAQYSIDDVTPFLHVKGSRIVDIDNDRQSLTDAASVLLYGMRTYPLQGGQWLQDALTVAPLAASLLADTAYPRPFFEALGIPGDPRIQLQDVVRLDDPHVLGGPIYASVVGIKRSISKRTGLRDDLTLRTFGAQGGSWVMGDPEFSRMGETTIVS